MCECPASCPQRLEIVLITDVRNNVVLDFVRTREGKRIHQYTFRKSNLAARKREVCRALPLTYRLVMDWRGEDMMTFEESSNALCGRQIRCCEVCVLLFRSEKQSHEKENEEVSAAVLCRKRVSEPLKLEGQREETSVD